jgi:hypothetical protein
MEEGSRQMTHVELDAMWSIATRKSIEDNQPYTRYEFAKMVAAKERAEMRKGYAGVTLWVGDASVTQIVSEALIEHEIKRGLSLEYAAKKCLEMYREARGEA